MRDIVWVAVLVPVTVGVVLVEAEGVGVLVFVIGYTSNVTSVVS